MASLNGRDNSDSKSALEHYVLTPAILLRKSQLLLAALLGPGFRV